MAQPLHAHELEPVPLPAQLSRQAPERFVLHTNLPDELVTVELQDGLHGADSLAEQPGIGNRWVVAFATEALGHVLARDPRASLLDPLPLSQWRYAHEVSRARARKERALGPSDTLTWPVHSTRHHEHPLRYALAKGVHRAFTPVMQHMMHACNPTVQIMSIAERQRIPTQT